MQRSRGEIYTTGWESGTEFFRELQTGSCNSVVLTAFSESFAEKLKLLKTQNAKSDAECFLFGFSEAFALQLKFLMEEEAEEATLS